MAKLCRMHFAGLGQDVARFNPLTIDLRNPKKDPQDSVIWLRNGGGKTTLISLLYSVFVPRVTDFLGMRTQKNAKLEDFLRPNEIGVVATEWLLPGTGGRRVVGQIAVSTARQFNRTFFSFSETAAFSFDSLPVLGLSNPAASMDRFTDALKDAMASDPAMELVLLQGQGEWVQHLDSIGLDSELFKTHIVMNSQEGGAADIFKIKTPEEFVRKFLELSYDESSSEEFEKSLEVFRQKRLNAPNYRAAIVFGESLCRLLTVFVQDIEKKARYQKEAEELANEMAAMLASINAHFADLEQKIQGLTAECELEEQTQGKKDVERRRQKNTAKGFDRYGKKLRVQETQTAFSQAETEKAARQLRVSIIQAAACFLELRTRESQQNALVDQQDRIRTEVKPLLDALKATGSRLAAAWNHRVSELHAAYQLTEEEVNKAKSDLNKIGEDITTTEVRRSDSANHRAAAEAAIRSFEEARRLLQNMGALQEGEVCEDAMRRLESEIKTGEDTIAKLAEKETWLKKQIVTTKATLQEVKDRIQQHQADVKDNDVIIAREEAARLKVLQLSVLQDISQGELLDLHNAHLRTQVEGHRDSVQTELVLLGVKDAEDKRDVFSLEKSCLFAPSNDVDVVMSRLRSLGIASALPAYHWLAEHYLAAGATKQLQRHPLALSGIIIQNEQDYRRAQVEIGSADIHSPVALIQSPKLEDGQGSTDVSIVTPARLGLFSKDEANREKAELDGRREQRATQSEHYEKVLLQAGEAIVKIQAFTSEFSVGRMKQIHEELAAARELETLARTEAEQVSAQLGDYETQKENIGEQKTTLLTNVQKARGYSHSLTQFFRDHDQKIEGHRKMASSARLAEEAAKLALLDLKSKRTDLDGAAKRLGEKATGQHTDWNLARKEKARLPKQYIGDPSGQSQERPEEVSPIFDAQVQEYEGKAQLGVIDGKLEAGATELGRAQESFNKASANLHLQDVEAAATSAQVEQDLADAQSALEEARGNLLVLDGDLKKARRDATADAEFKTGDLALESHEMPVTSADSFARGEACINEADRLTEEIDASKVKHQQLTSTKGGLEKESARYEQMAKRYENLVPTASPDSRFSGVSSNDDDITEDFCRRKRRVAGDLFTVQDKLAQKFDNEIQPLIQNPDLDKGRIPFRETLKRRARPDFDANSVDYLSDIRQQIAAYQHDLDSEEQELKIIVGQLNAIARRTTSLLAQTESASRMPDTLREWGGLSFLKIVVPKKNDEGERHNLLLQALEGWYERNTIPTGSGLAFECVYAVCGAKSVTVRMLKPEYHLSPVPHEITDMIKFSDGEKLTAAILLYCVLVRLRARARAKSLTNSGDSGMLLLDNPFGKATLAQFVDLQVKMARLNGVQLVYATGVNDFGALKSFDHIFRLRNTSRNRASGDYHVTQDLRERTIEGIAVGVELGNGKHHPENGNGSQAGAESQDRL